SPAWCALRKRELAVLQFLLLPLAAARREAHYERLVVNRHPSSDQQSSVTGVFVRISLWLCRFRSFFILDPVCQSFRIRG
ncbi:MAG: hypothetical protein E7K64_09420, partial [Clostridia bacterium]|nr:hypothetical protein [Clostridia bacterium]